MIQTSSGALERFQDSVGIKFQLYNSLFLSLPFFGVDRTGILLSLFNARCEEGFADGKSPAEIIDGFFAENATGESAAPPDLLFRFVQYAERQVVLFDALEDSAFGDLNDPAGKGTLKQLHSTVTQNNKLAEFEKKLQNFAVRLVLTAHPTQFYPGAVLGIINDLVEAIRQNSVSDINTLLQQLGRTPFFKKQKPTSYDEALSLIWYLENVFYDAAGNIVSELKNILPAGVSLGNVIRMGFWPGGDRDGNPFVTVDTTLKVADALRRAILRCYYRDVRRLKRRLTFTGVDALVAALEEKLYAAAFGVANDTGRDTGGDIGDDVGKDELLGALAEIREIIVSRHDGLFLHLVDDLIGKVETFGLYFASLDIRQESFAHDKVLKNLTGSFYLRGPDNEFLGDYEFMSDDKKIALLLGAEPIPDPADLEDELVRDTLTTMRAIKDIQRKNGRAGCERYIISQCNSAANVLEVYGLFAFAGWRPEEISVDIVPLFETIADLKMADGVMQSLYNQPVYREHLRRRGDKQIIMLGFSDGTKDGGYLMANWSIHQAKDRLTALAREHGISVVFFDGRGGPPARGGGKTHKFYSSMGENIANDEIQLTVQGQTVSSNFGTIQSAQYNIEQLLNAGVNEHLTDAKAHTFSEAEETLMDALAGHSFAAYQELKNDPKFLAYLTDVSPLRFYAEANIGSRPAKRGQGKLTLKDLRAIPFVGAWSQLKQNVPGFYGVGTALEIMADKTDEIAEMYRANSFFKTLIDNCEMAMEKSFFPLTAFVADDPLYGEIWQKISSEYELCRNNLRKISGKTELMEDYPVERKSVQMRERIVLPLTTIQQYALAKLRLGAPAGREKETYEKLIIRCSFGIINAGRNSA